MRLSVFMCLGVCVCVCMHVFRVVMIAEKNLPAISGDLIVMFILPVSLSHGCFVYRIATMCAHCSRCKNGSTLI